MAGDDIHIYDTENEDEDIIKLNNSARVFNVDENYIYLYENDYTENKKTISRVFREDGSVKELAVVNEVGEDKFTYRTENRLYVGDVVDGKFFYYDNEIQKVKVVKIE